MKNTNTTAQNTNETITNNGAIETVETVEQKTLTAADTAKADDVVAEVVKAGKLQGVKASLRRRSWVDVVGAGAIAAAGSVGDMLVTNKLRANLDGDNAEQYSALEIAGVGTATALVASTLRFGLDFVPVVNNNFMASVVSTSLVGNGTFVASAYVRDAALNLIKGKIAVNVEDLAAEA
jgi:hypothetical protein